MQHKKFQIYTLKINTIIWHCKNNSDYFWTRVYNDVIMSAIASQITSLTIVYSAVYSRRRSKKTSKLRVTGLCEGNSPGTGEFPAQMASNTENVSIWWCHHEWYRTLFYILAIWRCRKNFSQWQRSFHWKLCSNWLKWKKHILFCNLYDTCRWPSTVWCQAISNHNDYQGYFTWLEGSLHRTKHSHQRKPMTWVYLHYDYYAVISLMIPSFIMAGQQIQRLVLCKSKGRNMNRQVEVLVLNMLHGKPPGASPFNSLVPER